MIKLPEPWGCMDQRGRLLADGDPAGAALYTEAQLKQAVRDAYEDAANLCCNDHDCGAIRALIKEIE